jgi:iron complex transport system permease protein
MTDIAGVEAAAPRLRDRRRRAVLAITIAAALALVAAIASVSIGPVPIAPLRVLTILLHPAAAGDAMARDAVIVWNVRLPRTLLGLAVGAATAVSGAVMQGLFRNPIADPGIIGVSSGAALAAAFWFVLGGSLVAARPAPVGDFGLPLAAFVGGLAVTILLQVISRRGGRTSVTTLVLAGIAVSTFAGAGIGILVFIATDEQLRAFTFWTMGSLGGATFERVLIALPFTGLFVLLAPALGRALDALALGEAEAFHLGIDVEFTKRAALAGVAAAVGASVAVSGIIGFVGLAVPHLVRLSIGPAHRLLLVVSAFVGGALLVATDLVARTVASPAEIPLGIITALFGAPFMLWLLLQRRRDIIG